jgi:hypothetical protein
MKRSEDEQTPTPMTAERADDIIAQDAAAAFDAIAAQLSPAARTALQAAMSAVAQQNYIAGLKDGALRFCPECKNKALKIDDSRRDGRGQRWSKLICKFCGYRKEFTSPDVRLIEGPAILNRDLEP